MSKYDVVKALAKQCAANELYDAQRALDEYAAHLAAQAEWPSDDCCFDVALAYAKRRRVALTDDMIKGMRAALQSVRPPVGVVSNEEWLKLADELEAFKPRGELGALHGAGMAFAYADAAKTIRAKVEASRHAPTKD